MGMINIGGNTVFTDGGDGYVNPFGVSAGNPSGMNYFSNPFLGGVQSDNPWVGDGNPGNVPFEPIAATSAATTSGISNPFGIGVPGSSNSFRVDNPPVQTPFGTMSAFGGAAAPTQASVNANPSAYAGTSFDPARYLTYAGSPYGPGLSGNASTGASGSGTPPSPQSLATTLSDPTGQNHNIYANFLAAQSPVAQILAQMLTAGEAPMRQAQQWLAANVRPDATTANPGADFTSLGQFWSGLNNSISANGNATPGVPNLGNGISGGSATTTTADQSQGKSASTPYTAGYTGTTGGNGDGYYGFSQDVYPGSPAYNALYNSGGGQDTSTGYTPRVATGSGGGNAGGYSGYTPGMSQDDYYGAGGPGAGSTGATGGYTLRPTTNGTPYGYPPAGSGGYPFPGFGGFGGYPFPGYGAGYGGGYGYPGGYGGNPYPNGPYGNYGGLPGGPPNGGYGTGGFPSGTGGGGQFDIASLFNQIFGGGGVSQQNSNMYPGSPSYYASLPGGSGDPNYGLYSQQNSNPLSGFQSGSATSKTPTGPWGNFKSSLPSFNGTAGLWR